MAGLNHGPRTHPVCLSRSRCVRTTSRFRRQLIAVPSLAAFIMVFVAMEDLVFRVLAAAPRCPSLVRGRTTAVTFMAVAFAFLAAHVFWPFTATARVTAATAVMVGPAMIIMGLRETARGKRHAKSTSKKNRSGFC